MIFKKMFDEIITEEEIGKFAEFGNYRFCVYGENDNIPHFHFIEGNPKSPLSEGCLRLDKVEYFDHGNHTGRLPKREYRFIIKFLSVDSNYINVVSQWNEHSPYKLEISKENFNNPYKTT